MNVPTYLLAQNVHGPVSPPTKKRLSIISHAKLKVPFFKLLVTSDMCPTPLVPVCVNASIKISFLLSFFHSCFLLTRGNVTIYISVGLIVDQFLTFDDYNDSRDF